MSDHPLLLDTHVWYRAQVSPDRIHPETRATLVEAVRRRIAFISVISVWELAMLERDKKLELEGGVRNWTARALSNQAVSLVAYSPAIAIDAVHLPLPMHKDPSDRILVATARVEGMTFVTSDKAILKFAKLIGLSCLRA